MRTVSGFNPLTHLVNGVRYSAIGDDFYSIGIHYAYSRGDILLSLDALAAFAALMFTLEWWVFKRAVIT